MPFPELQGDRRRCLIHPNPTGAHTCAGKGCEWAGAEERNCCVLTISTSTLGLWHLGGVEEYQVEDWCWIWEKDKEESFVFVSHYLNPSLLYLATEWLSLWTADIALLVKENREGPQLPAGLVSRICSAGKKRALERQSCDNGVCAGDRLCNPEPNILTISIRSIFSSLGSNIQSGTGLEQWNFYVQAGNQ